MFVGPHGVGRWQDKELEAALRLQVDMPSFRVIPVLLPEATMPEREDMSLFLSGFTWVDFRGPLVIENPEAFGRLVAGIRGKAPRRGYKRSPSVSTFEEEQKNKVCRFLEDIGRTVRVVDMLSEYTSSLIWF